MEIAAITKRFDDYCESLEVGENDLVDLSLVRDMVDIEVQILRADALLARDANFIEDVVVGVGEDGSPYFRPEVHKAMDTKSALRRERHRILQLLNSTRKDRQGRQVDPSSIATALMLKAAELERQGALKEREKEDGRSS